MDQWSDIFVFFLCKFSVMIFFKHHNAYPAYPEVNSRITACLTKSQQMSPGQSRLFAQDTELVWWGQPSMKTWTCGRVKEHHDILLIFPAQPGGSSSWLFLILTCTHKICLVLLYSVNVWWILSQKNAQKIIFLLVPQTGQPCISVASFITTETYW